MCLLLSREDSLRLAEDIGDTPVHAVCVGALQTGRCAAYTLGDPRRPEAAVVRVHALPSEPFAFGSPAGIDRLLATMSDWGCVSVAAELAEPLAERFRTRYGGARLYRDVYLVARPAPDSHRPADRGVRLLGAEDQPLLGAVSELAGADPAHLRYALERAALAVAELDGQIVAEAHCGYRTRAYADISINTREGYRGRGLATACAAVVRGRLAGAGLTPVWSAGHDNRASLRVAEKLGFAPVGERAYVIRP